MGLHSLNHWSLDVCARVCVRMSVCVCARVDGAAAGVV